MKNRTDVRPIDFTINRTKKEKNASCIPKSIASPPSLPVSPPHA